MFKVSNLIKIGKELNLSNNLKTKNTSLLLSRRSRSDQKQQWVF